MRQLSSEGHFQPCRLTGTLNRGGEVFSKAEYQGSSEPFDITSVVDKQSLQPLVEVVRNDPLEVLVLQKRFGRIKSRNFGAVLLPGSHCQISKCQPY